MLHFNLQKPIELNLVGEYVSPERGFVHLTRVLLDYELFLVTEGTLYIADEKAEYCVNAGEYLIMSPTRYQHGTKNCCCRFYWMHFQCPAQPASLSLPPQGNYSEILPLINIMKKLFTVDAREHRGLHSHYLATELLLELATQQKSAAPLEETSLNAAELLCEKIKSFVQWQRFTNVKVSEIAKELGYHEKYLSAVFRKTQGITLKAYLLNLRLSEAKRLLLESSASIVEISYYLNFGSPHNFCRFFKKEAGITPTEYRENKKFE